MSWSFVPKGLLGREQKRRKPPSTKPVLNMDLSREDNIRRSKKKKDRPRGIVDDGLDDARVEGKFAVAKAFMGLNATEAKKSEPSRDAPVRERERPRRPQDRPREDRSRRSRQSQTKVNASVAPVQKSVVPSLREKKGVGSIPPLTQRMRSADSSDPVTSRISSDLSSTLDRSMGSRSGNSTPVHMKTRQAGEQEFDPAANGVSSDVSSHENSGLPGKMSPDEHTPMPEDPGPPIGMGGVDFSTINAARASRNPQLRSELFAFPSSSTESGGFFGPSDKSWENPRSAYPEYTTAESAGVRSDAGVDAAMFDPVARALEKNRSRSGGGPLSYLLSEQDQDMDVDTQSTGLTSLADESVSTHKTVSAVGEDYKMMPSVMGNPRYYHRGDAMGNARQLQEHREDMSDSSGSVQPHIFKNSALFSSCRPLSPSRVSNSSPRRFHSDWSDPHATDIERFCQCNCGCVYEEECRRTCELVYGRRSPSVSSSRSYSRRAGFQSLTPGGQDSELSTRKKFSSTPNYDDASSHSRGYNSTDREGEEKKVVSEKRYSQVIGKDEPLRSRSRRGPSTSSPYDPDSSNSGNCEMGTRQRHIYNEKNYEHDTALRGAQQFEDRPRRERREGHTERSNRNYKDYSKPSHSSSSRTGQNDATRVIRKYESRHLSGPRQETRPSSREQRSRPSSRNTSSSRQSSGQHKEYNGHGSGRQDESSEAVATERRRREVHERRKYGSSDKRLDGAQQMGNSYVLKRDGPPPFSQSNYPQPYRATEFYKDFDYELGDQEDITGSGETRKRTRDGLGGRRDVHSSVDHGPPPAVELEFDERKVSSPDVYRSGPIKGREQGHHGRPRTAGTRLESNRYKKPNNGRSTERKGANDYYHGAKGKGEVRVPNRPNSRQHTKGGNYGRTSLFGLF